MSHGYYSGEGIAPPVQGLHFLHIDDYTEADVNRLLSVAVKVKAKLKARETFAPLKDYTMSMIFAKPSLRTRVSFETGFERLGGHAVYLGPDDIQLGKREPIKDAARVLSRYSDVLMARLFAHTDLLELADYSRCPVINGLTDYNHPCQILGDALTIWEHKGKVIGQKLVFVGEGNNVCHSWLRFARIVPITLVICCPPGYEPDSVTVKAAQEAAVSNISVTHDLLPAVEGADIVYADVWASMGHKDELALRLRVFQPYQISMGIMARAKPDAIFMHCLPTERGKEVTDDVLESEQSVVFDQAENREHAQNAVVLNCLGLPQG